MNFVGYDEDEEDVEVSEPITVDQRQVEAREALTSENPLELGENRTQAALESVLVDPKYQRLCDLVQNGSNKSSFLETCKSSTLFQLPDLVDQIAIIHDLTSAASQLSQETCLLQWQSGHPGKAVLDESGK